MNKTAARIARRFDRQQYVAAEHLICAALSAVEDMGCDVRLTDAVVLLGAAKDSVADFVDGFDQRRYVTHGTAPGPTPQAAATSRPDPQEPVR